MLSFLTGVLEKYGKQDKKDEIEKIKEIFGEMFGRLLSYIDSQNVRFIRQREELIDLSVKIAGMNHGGDTEEAMDEVINNYKSILPSGEGLRDIINSIKERYPWSTFK